MKREVIESITEIEDSTMIEVTRKAHLLCLTVSQYLEGSDGRVYRFRKCGNDVCLFTRKAYNNAMKYGEYGSKAFTPEF